MNSLSLRTMFILSLFATLSLSCKRPRKEKPAKEPRPALTDEQKQVITANVAQVMSGICTIAQDPRNPHNIGSSIGSMIQALITIIITKFARRSININDAQFLQECIDELTQDINAEITKIIKINKKQSIARPALSMACLP